MDRPPQSRRAQRQEQRANRGDEREQAILDSLEALLQDRSLVDVTIEEIARGAGLSRPSLYFYFASKDQMISALLTRSLSGPAWAYEELLVDIDGGVEVLFERVMDALLETWRANAHVLEAAIEAGQDEGSRRLWGEVIASYIAVLGDWITRERERGRLPVTPESPAELATIACWMGERNLYQLFSQPHTPAQERRTIELIKVAVLRLIGYSEVQQPPGRHSV